MRRTIVMVAVVLVALGGAAWAAPAGKVVIAQGVEPTTLDPHGHAETPAYNVLENVYDLLLNRDNALTLRPLLAESYRIVNPTTWEFKLRRGIKFTNGEDMDADAVKYSLERIIDPAMKLRQAPALNMLDTVKVIDKYTVHILTKKPYAPLDAQLSQIGNIVPPKYFKAHDPAHLAKNPVGTGAYKFVEWKKDERIVLEANEQHFRGAPAIKQVIYRPIPETNTRVAALQAGDVDIIVNVPPHLIKTIEANPSLSVSTAPSARVIYVAIDTLKGGPMANKKVRQAVNLAVDKEGLIKNVMEGQAYPLAGQLSPLMFGFDKEVRGYGYDAERAKRLLAEAGYPNGIDTVLNTPDGRYVNDKQVAEAVGGSLAKAGIRAEVRPQEWGTFLNKMIYVKNAGPMFLIGWGNPSFDADGTLYPLLHSSAILSNYSSKDFDGLIEEARSTMDGNKRQELYSKAVRLAVDDAAWVPLYQQKDLYGVNKRIEWKARSDERLNAIEMKIVR